MKTITLNDEQKLGSDPVKSQFLIANAGSGKTFVLIERFKNIINKKLNELNNETINKFNVRNSNNSNSEQLGLYINQDKFNQDEFNQDTFNQEILLKEIIEDVKENFNFLFFVICSFSEKTSFDLQQKVLKKLKDIKNDNYNNFKIIIEKYKSNIKEISDFFEIIQIDRIKEEEDLNKLFEINSIFNLIINNNELFNIYLNKKYLDFFIDNIFKFQVSTIHSFCIQIIKEYYYEMELEPDFIINDFYLNKLSSEEAFIILNDPTLLKLYNKKYNLNLKIDGDGQNDLEKVSELLFIFYNLFDESESNYSKDTNLKLFFKEIATEVNIYKLEEAIRFFEISINISGDGNKLFNNAKEFNEELLFLIKLYFNIIKGIYKKYNIVNYNQQLSLVDNFLKGDNHKDITELFSKKIEYLLVDEFQDTDIIQTSIFETLASKNPTMSLFFVGDPKQSIYKFRGSDIRIFNKTKEHFKNSNRIIENNLDISYRSTPNIASFVNDFFNRYLNENNNTDTNQNIKFEYNNLKYPLGKYYKNEINFLKNPKEYTKSFENFGRIDYILGFKKIENLDKTQTKDTTKKWEEIANYILDLIENHKIFDKNKENETTERKLEFRDIAILTRINFKEDDIKKLTEVFNRKHINFEIGKNLNFYEDEIIIAIIGFLEFVFDNTNDNSLYNLLLSKFYGFDYETLFFTINLIQKLNNLSPEDTKYFSLWDKLKLIQDLNLDIDINTSNSNNCIVENQKEIEENIEFLIYIQNMVTEINSYLNLYSKVFASELLIMFLKNNFFYNHLEHFIGQNEINILQLNINKFLQLIHNLEKKGFVDFSLLIENIKNLKLKEDEESVYSKNKENSVSILTIHNSKGLEFPVVILVGRVNSSTDNYILERETGIINKFKPLENFDKQFLTDNNIFNINTVENIHSKINKFNLHLNELNKDNSKSKNKISNFKILKDKYEELEILNLTYVAFTRAINVFCVFHELSNKNNKNGDFHATDLKNLKYIMPNYLIDTMKLNLQNDILDNETLYHKLKFYNNQTEEFEYQIPINFKLYNQYNINDINDKTLSIETHTYNNEKNIDKSDINKSNNDKKDNIIENKNYIFEVKDKFFSATKLLSLNSDKLNYELKYLLGLNDRLALQLEEEEKSQKNYLTEFDEFDLYTFSILNKEKKENITKEIYDQMNLKLKKAAEFGLSFHFVIQNIKFLFNKTTLELNNDILEDLINECMNQYKLLDNEKVEKIKLILNKMSGSEFLKTIYDNYENIKTEFSLNIPFYKIKENETLHFLNGNIDLIYKNKSNEIIIIDWKTNQNVDNDTRANYKMQATMYKYMMSNLYPNYKIRFQFVFTKDILENTEEKDWVFEPDLDDDILELEENIKNKISEIISLETHLYD